MAEKTTNQTIETETTDTQVQELKDEVETLRQELKELKSQLNAVKGSGPYTPFGEGKKSGELVSRVVLKNGIGYRRVDPKDHSKIVESRLAKRGEVVLLTQDQVEKLEASGAVGSESDLKAPDVISDEEISQMNLPVVISKLKQHSDDVQFIGRVEALEQSRGDEARPEVFAAVEKIRIALQTI